MSTCLGILTGGTGQAIGSLVGPVVEAGKGIFHSVKSRYDYIKNVQQNLENLEREERYLSAREKDIQQFIAKNQLIMESTHECTTWLEDAKRTIQNVKELKTRYQASINSSRGLSQMCARLKFSKEIVKLTNSVVHLKDQMKKEDILLAERLPDKVEKKFPYKLDEVPSLRENVEKLLELLRDDSITKIGIWGMPGVGKTKILENLNDEVEKLQVFDIVIWVTVSKEWNLQRLQLEILQRLGVKAEGVERQNRAKDLISKSLEKKNSYLLLLDEVFYEFDLRHIGFCENHNGKVVLATREKNTCSLMDTDEEIKVERLSRDDARMLFRTAVGKAIDNQNIRPIAERVLKQCGELPHLIKAVGRHLRGKSKEDVWWETLSKLQSPNMHQLEHMEDVLNPFKVVFEELPGTLRNCLLYTASFPKDHEIYQDYLIECWKAEQLIGIGKTFRETRQEGHTKLEILTDKCLLDTCRSSKFVKMPIIFRNTAIRVANGQGFGLLVKDSEEFEDPPEESWTEAKVISLMNSNLVQLPLRPNCSMLSTLFLQKNGNLSMLPQLFFNCMSTLKILDLGGTAIRTLPSCISNLTNLKGIYLYDCCKLECLPQEIKGLKNVELLDISHSGIRAFPALIRELTSLRCLRASLVSVAYNQNGIVANDIEVTPFETVQQLSNLEELTIDVDLMDSKWNEIEPEAAKKVAKLEKLSTISFWFTSAESIKIFTHTSKSWNNSSRPGSNFRSFNIIVGSQGTNKSPRLDVSECSGQRYLQYSGGKDNPSISNIKKVLRRTCAFELIGHENITYFSDFGIDEMDGLEVCLVEECNKMKAFLGNQTATAGSLPGLKELHLRKLKQLNAINQGPVSSNSLASLTTLTLYDCPSIIKVVSWDMAKQLCELQHFRVEKCTQVEEIIATDNQSSGITAFPKLKILELIMLKGLVRIHSDASFKWRDLQKIDILECNKLENLHLSTKNATKLRCIRCSEAWWRPLAANGKVEEALEDVCRFV